VAAYWRVFEGERLLAIHNLSGSAQAARLEGKELAACELHNLLTGETLAADETGRLELRLEPYQYLWLERRPLTA
jgi:hypothetical protein